MTVRWTMRSMIRMGKEGGDDEGHEDRPGRGAVGRAAESADSDAAAVVLGIVIDPGLSTSGKGTGRSSGLALTGNGIQASPVLMRPLPLPLVRKILAGLGRSAWRFTYGRRRFVAWRWRPAAR